MQAEYSRRGLAACKHWILLWLLLTPLSAFAAEPPWWNASYLYRQQIMIPAGTSAALPANYAVSFTFNHASEVTAGRSLASGNDVRIVRWNGSAWEELNRIAEPFANATSSVTPWNTTTTPLWFKTAAIINAGATNGDYYVYYGNPASGAPPQDGNQVFTLWDEFTAAPLNSTKWAGTGVVTFSGGAVQLGAGATLRSKTTYGSDTIWEARLRTNDVLPGGGDKTFYYWTASNASTPAITSYNSNHTGFFSNTSGSFVWSRNSAATQNSSGANTFNYAKYAFARQSTPAQVRFLVNGTALSTVHNAAANVPTASLPIMLYNDANGTRNMIYDWIRIRPYRFTEPTLTLAAREQMASGRHFLITHDRFGIRCTGETVTVRVLDSANAPVTNYNFNVTLTTGVASGAWARISGSGTFLDASATDGNATYTWPTGESVAVFSLVYGDGASPIDIDVYQSNDMTVRDDDTEGTMTFSQSGFTVTSSTVTNPSMISAFASPQTAGANVPMYIYPYGTTATDTQCGIIEAYTGTKTLRFWSSYADPASGSRTVTINGSAIGTSAATATSLSVNFQNGQGIVNAKYKDVGSIAINVTDPNVADPALPAGAQGSTGNVVFRPHTFVLSNIRSTATGAANGVDDVFLRAGEDFSVTVEARDFEGSATPNYGRESTPESVGLTATVVAPSAAHNPPLQANAGFASFTNGTASATDFSWPEVGIIRLTAEVADGSYLGAGNVSGTPSGNVGRFIPAYFQTATNAPMFAPSCINATAGTAYTYMGQPFDYMIPPVLSVTAYELGGNVTENYRDEFLKITSATVTDRTYSDSNGHTLITSLLPTPTDELQIGPGVAGVVPLTFKVRTPTSGQGLMVERLASPQAPFDADISLSFQLTDSDGVAAASNPVSFDNIAFTMSSQQRWGRIAFRNAVGSELIDLPLPMRAEYYMSDAVGFITNNADTCSDIPIGPGALSGVATTTTLTSPPSNSMPGDFNLVLRAPGNNNSGTVRVNPMVPPWLQYNWNAMGMENPTGIATFGIYKGSSKQIYRRERF